ncbi:MAG: tRNA (adenosine(37)-N6)-threonylcarbamoyltransferase complex dimerization subunit type 1 TsaB [Draconibacterium sp.]|nr:MAG: tRNA (adenosine(37)-N6)-threonylcarbamoyltransferase complex dimerization subunit type 1 TsaB [Draconibacterium sp.]
MATILHIETSTEVCSVALAQNGKLIALKESTQGLKHAELLTVFVETVFSECGIPVSALDAVAVSKGPGSYTGLRIGVSVAKGLCYALDIPLIAVSSLDILGTYTAKNTAKFDIVDNKSNLFCPLIDARRMEVYTALYNIDGIQVRPVTAEIVDGDSFREFLDKQPVIFFGNGAEKCRSVLTHKNAFFGGPYATSAQFMISIVYEKYKSDKTENVAYFEPFYLKDFIATIPKNKII